MPSPVTMPALVFWPKTRPAPPVHMIAALHSIRKNSPLAMSIATTPCTRPSSTTRSAQKNSS